MILTMRQSNDTLQTDTAMKRIGNLLLATITLLVVIACTSNDKQEEEPLFRSWAPTPPLGWNSFDCYGSTVTEEEVKANADYMAANLKAYGYEYIVVDIRWYDKWYDNSHAYNVREAQYDVDDYGRLLPDAGRFPSSANGAGLKPLADYVHDKGLKFGIHIMRGIPREAVKRNTPVRGSDATAADIYSEENPCGWLTDMYTVDATKEGAQAYYNSVFDLCATWGIDFVKIDDLSFPYHADEIELIRNAIDQCGRPIVLSVSPGETPIDNAEHVQGHTNMWRVIGDLWDRWEQVEALFDICAKWTPYIREGSFPDGDMLPLGHIGIRGEIGEERMSDLTSEEQRTLMTLFAICRSPLMFGGNLPDTDPETLALITNKGMLQVNQHSRDNRQLYREGDIIAWTADDPDSTDKYLALFNAQELAAEEPADTLTAPLSLIGTAGDCTVTDLWTGLDLGTFADTFKVAVKRHDAGLYRISPRQQPPKQNQLTSAAIRTTEYRQLQERLCTGWNTWYNNSVTSHVLLPENFFINVGLTTDDNRNYQRYFIKNTKDVVLGMRTALWLILCPRLRSSRVTRVTHRRKQDNFYVS